MAHEELEEQHEFANVIRKMMGLPVTPEEIAADMIRRNGRIVEGGDAR
jgi:hypothetical protein